MTLRITLRKYNRYWTAMMDKPRVVAHGKTLMETLRDFDIVYHEIQSQYKESHDGSLSVNALEEKRLFLALEDK
jgi:hypothetical protein